MPEDDDAHPRPAGDRRRPRRPTPSGAGPIAAALAAAPKPAGLTAAFQTAPRRDVALAITGAPLKGADLHERLLLPLRPHRHRPRQAAGHRAGPDGLTLTLAPGYAFQAGRRPAEDLAGVLAVDGKAYEIAAAAGRRRRPGASRPRPAGRRRAQPPAAPSLGLAAAALFALLGGLILNLMPCVFPILAMKAASLAGHARASRRGAQPGPGLPGAACSADLPGARRRADRAEGRRLGGGLGLPAAVAAGGGGRWRC